MSPPMSTSERAPLDATFASAPVRSGRDEGQRQERTRRLLLRAANTESDVLRSQLHDEVVRLNMPVARSVAARYKGRGVALDDLQQVAFVGLIYAVQHFELAHGKDFLAYAVPTMRGTVKRYFRDHGWVIRPPRRVQELQAAITRTREALTVELGRSPRPREVAEHLGVDEEAVLEVLAMGGCFAPTSLDKPLGGDPGRDPGSTLGDLLADNGRCDGREAAEARVMLANAVRHLGERDRVIVRMRFFEQCTQVEIARAIGVTQMQVSRLLTRIMRDLRADILGSETEELSR